MQVCKFTLHTVPNRCCSPPLPPGDPTRSIFSPTLDVAPRRDQTERDNIIANFATMNHHGHAWHTGINSGTAPHDGQCTGTVTISSDASFSDGHLPGLSFHDNADCTWVLDSGTASDTTTVSVSFLDIAGGWDTLTISDSAGDVLAVFSGLQIPPPISAVGPLTVRFQTDGKVRVFLTTLPHHPL